MFIVSAYPKHFRKSRPDIDPSNIRHRNMQCCQRQRSEARVLVEMNADPVYVFLLVLIVFLLYIIVREKEAAPVSKEPAVIQRVIAAPSYYGWWPSRFYGGYAGDVWFRDHIGPGHYWGPHIHPGRRYF